ncbi:MAG: tetratricopeptide repeat protein [Ferruginibacter sp.]
MRSVSLLLFFLIAGFHAKCQLEPFSPEEWAKKLMDAGDRENHAALSLMDTLDRITYILPPDSCVVRYKAFVPTIEKMLPGIEKAADNGNPYFISRINCLKAMLLSIENGMIASTPSHKQKVMELMADAMHTAHETNDEYLEAFVANEYFSRMKYYEETALAVIYGLYSAELYEKLGLERFPKYEFLSEIMYRVREYDKCIEYSKKWLVSEKSPDLLRLGQRKMFTLNTLGLAFHRKSMYDSALFYYNKSLSAAEKEANRPDWVGIISGNMGQVYYLQRQYDTAKALLEKDYKISMSSELYDNAANSLQWVARANAALGNNEKALQQVREAMQLIQRMPDRGYQQNIYYAAIEIYSSNNHYDSALYYSTLYQKLHDTIEKNINLSSVAVSRVRLTEEKYIYDIRRLQLEKKAQTQQRNFVIAGILFLALTSILLINRQRLKHKYKQQSLEMQNKIIEQEISSAKKQMAMFTDSIIEKTTVIEKLEQQMQESQLSAGQQEAISVLSHLTILTEDDWEKFKALFEKIYPLFFQKLKLQAPDITLAEQRMAALIRLQLTTRQMASMQGISPDSVHKTRQRLRQRLDISNEVNLEEYFSGL